jgi:hypothetical protein
MAYPYFIGDQIIIRGHFCVPLALEDANPLGARYECRNTLQK